MRIQSLEINGFCEHNCYAAQLYLHMALWRWSRFMWMEGNNTRRVIWHATLRTLATIIIIQRWISVYYVLNWHISTKKLNHLRNEMTKHGCHELNDKQNDMIWIINGLYWEPAGRIRVEIFNRLMKYHYWYLEKQLPQRPLMKHIVSVSKKW